MLEGLKVVELATYIAAPGAAGILADWGASVIKVEAPNGDPIRQFFATIAVAEDSNPVYDMDNRGKRGIVIDIAKPDGRDVLVSLARDADVFITNVRPGALARAGLAWADLKAANARLIYASVTGYGLEGPDADKPGFDMAAFWARSGVAALTIPKGAEPFPLRTGFGDHVCSLATASAILAALYKRKETGEGRLVETSLLRTGIYALSSDLAIQMRMGRIASTRPRAQAVNPLVNFFQTADGKWLCLLPRQGAPDWPNIARAAKREDLLEDPRFKTSRARRENGADLVAALDTGFAAMTLAEAAARLKGEDIVWAPVQSPREVLEDEQARAAGAFARVMDDEGGMLEAPASPARFDGASDPPRPPAPSLGQHTDEILACAGYSPEQISELRRTGAVS